MRIALRITGVNLFINNNLHEADYRARISSILRYRISRIHKIYRIILCNLENHEILYDIEAFILAGGASSRMGTDKSQLLIDHQTFTERIAETLLKLTDSVTIVGKTQMTHLSQAFQMFIHNGARWVVFTLRSLPASVNGPSSLLAICHLLPLNCSCTSRRCAWTTKQWFPFNQTAGRNRSPLSIASIPAGNELPS